MRVVLQGFLENWLHESGKTSIFAVDGHYFIISTNIVPEHNRSLYANIDLQRLTKDVVSICRVRIN